jgi:ketosteroid isomerase-like protein
MDPLRELYHPDAIMRMPEGWPEPGPYYGRDAVMREFGQLRETGDADALEVISDFIDVADHVVLRFVWRGQGRGPEANVEMTCLYTVRKSKIIGQEFFWDHSEVLEAMGLAE